MKNPKAPDPNEYPEVKKVRPISPLKAVLFYFGPPGVKKDTSEAIRWWKKAAALGNSDAIKMLRDKGYNV